MKAARWHARNDIRLDNVPEPSPSANDIVIEIEWCGICGTDLGEYIYGPLQIPVDRPHPLSGVMAPLIMGHEFAGKVVEVGQNVSHLKIGDRVGVGTILSCGKCYWCKRNQNVLCPQMGVLGLHAHGGLAEYCVAPADICLRLPQNLLPESAPVAETLAVVVRAARKGRMVMGETVAIIGAGAVGLLAVQLMRVAGAEAIYVVEPSPMRRQKALALGATAAFNPAEGDVRDELLTRTGGKGADLTLECAGHHQTVLAAIEVTRSGGRIVIIGVPKKETKFNFMELVLTEKEVMGSKSHVFDEDYYTAVRLLGDGRILADPIITHRISLDNIVDEGFNRLAQGNLDDVLKIIVSPAGLK